MPYTKSSLLSLIALASQASAWGTLGHTTVALIAQSFLLNKTATYTQSVLNDTSSLYLYNIATWADSYRYTDEGAFSAPFHYIDAFDTPPTSCNVDFERDCPEEGCIVSAIANYTTRLTARNESISERQKALKWVVHFLGDVHQPLHVENLAVGGNLINVTFDNATVNLHAMWDTRIPEKLIGGSKLADSLKWSAALIGEIKDGKYANATKSWLEGIDPEDGIASAMHWASDSNAYVCTTVVPEGQEGVEGKELGGAYYETAIPVVQLQIAKAGYRLAAWLNLAVTGKLGLGGHGHGFGHGYPGGSHGPKGKVVKREEAKLEDWMVEARRVRRETGWECADHEH